MRYDLPRGGDRSFTYLRIKKGRLVGLCQLVGGSLSEHPLRKDGKSYQLVYDGPPVRVGPRGAQGTIK